VFHTQGFFCISRLLSLKLTDMKITIKINRRSEQAKAFYEYLKTLPFIEIEDVRYNKNTEKAIKDVKSGKTTKISLEDFRKQLYS